MRRSSAKKQRLRNGNDASGSNALDGFPDGMSLLAMTHLVPWNINTTISLVNLLTACLMKASWISSRYVMSIQSGLTRMTISGR